MSSPIGFLFGAAGRFRRLDYWIHALLAVVIWVVAGYLSVSYISHLAQTLKELQGQAQPHIPPDIWQAMAGFLFFMLVMLWMGFANLIKRFHDFGQSGWNSLWFFVPFVNIYFGFKLAFFRGDQGDNAYGPSPYRPQPPKPPRDQVL